MRKMLLAVVLLVGCGGRAPLEDAPACPDVPIQGRYCVEGGEYMTCTTHDGTLVGCMVTVTWADGDRPALCVEACP